jgi:hypothetical protein
MKPKSLNIKNIGIIADTTIETDKPLLLFYGDIMQGKTTILNAVKWLFGGSYPSDIIRHGEKEASILLKFENGSISREWYVNKEGETTDRPIVFIQDGTPVKKPVAEIKKFLNPYLLDNEYLKKMSETEQKKYFADLFGVDTSDIDKQISTAASEAQTIRATIKGYGEIDTTEVKPVNVDALKERKGAIVNAHNDTLDKIRAELAEIRQNHLAMVRATEEENKEIRGHNTTVESKSRTIDECGRRIDDITIQIANLQREREAEEKMRSEAHVWLNDNPTKAEKQAPTPPDTTALEEKLTVPADTAAIDEEISQANATNVRYEQYKKNLERQQKKETDEKKLSDLEAKQRDLKKQKLAKLKDISETCGIPGLSFDENGAFTYDGTMSGMLSTAQIMQLSSELSALYPAGFGLDLIDRGESLGKSIFAFVEKAEREEKTILATIVGEKPAVVPENIGVFVVENGEVRA